MKLSIIVPCFNEAAVLPLFYGEIKKILNGLTNYDSEIIFVDDGSSDETQNTVKSFAFDDDKVKYISFSRNFGKEAAMLAGLRNADGDYVAIMDADMQDPPALLPDMIKILETGEYDSVATRRADRKGEPPIRSACSRAFYKIINKAGSSGIRSNARDFRLMKRTMVDAVLSLSETNRFTKGIFGWVGFKTYWLSFDNAPRAAGKTKWNFKKLFDYSVTGIVNFSDAPIRAIVTTGAVLSALSVTALIVFLILRLCGVFFSSLWVLVAFVGLFGGAIITSTGIVGIYVYMALGETKRRPPYIVSSSNFTNPK